MLSLQSADSNAKSPWRHVNAGVGTAILALVILLAGSIAQAQNTSKTATSKTKTRAKAAAQEKSKLVSSEEVKPLLKLEEVMKESPAAADVEQKPAAEDKKPPIRDFKPILAHEFTGVQEWINTRPLDMESLRGRVVVLHFFGPSDAATACTICRTTPSGKRNSPSNT